MGAVLTYYNALAEAMKVLADIPETLFVGQAVRYDGQAAFDTFKYVPMSRRIEMPVCEDFQMGFCSGLALEGFVPVCFFPRFDFLIIALNQLVNHLDKFPYMGDFAPKVIIRTAVGRNKPLDPGPQHVGDYTDALRKMLRTVPVIEARWEQDVRPAYQYAALHAGSVLIVEHMDQY